MWQEESHSQRHQNFMTKPTQFESPSIYLTIYIWQCFWHFWC